MRTLRMLVTVAVAMNLSACASMTGVGAAEAQPTLFARADATAQQHVIDDEDCRVAAKQGSLLDQASAGAGAAAGLGLGASLAIGVASGLTAGLLEPKRRVDAHDRCMAQRGYGRVAVSAEQQKAYLGLTSLDEKAAWLTTNSISKPVAPAQPGAPAVRTVTRF